MTLSSEGGSDKEIQKIQVVLDGLDRCSWLDLSDGCRVVAVDCDACGVYFDEELEEAKAKVITEDAFVCLECDKKADLPALIGYRLPMGIMLWFGWGG